MRKKKKPQNDQAHICQPCISCGTGMVFQRPNEISVIFDWFKKVGLWPAYPARIGLELSQKPRSL